MSFNQNLSLARNGARRPGLLAVIFITLCAITGDARGQIRSPMFESPWRGYDTGAFGTGFDPGGFGPASIAVGDIDNDGDADAVTGNQFSARAGISVLLNGGDGSYSLPVQYQLADDQSVGDVALAHVNQDGHADVIGTISGVSGTSNTIVVWRNNGNGTFAAPQQFIAGPGPVGLAVADFNGDGFPDVATANYGYVANTNNTVSILLHNGYSGASAGFLPPVEVTVPGMDTKKIAAADINGDGKADLAVVGKDRITEPVQPIGARLAVLKNDGKGLFTVSETFVSFPGARSPSYAVGLADLDNDGDADLIGGGAVTSGSTDRGGVSVRRNAGNGTFGAVETYTFDPSVWLPSSFSVGDINRDGLNDIVSTTPTGRTMDGWVALINNGAGGFHPSARYEASQETVDAALADADLDGDLDVITVALSSSAITVHPNLGDGSFPVFPRNLIGVESGGLVGNFTQAVEAGDVDRDGDIDIVTNDEKATILKNNGDGTFAAAVSYTPPHNFAEVKLRDLNGDGNLDLLFGPDPNAPPYNFATALNNGDGSFASGTITYLNACQGGSIDAFDLDNDGDLDVVVTEEGACAGGEGRGIFLARNDGAAKFTLVAPLAPPCFAVGIAGGDLNGDGNIDLVSTGCSGPMTLLGNGDLTFKPGIDSSNIGPHRFKLSDLNRDGKLDLAMTVGQAAQMTLRIGTALGNGDGTFADARLQSGSSVLENLRIANDIDVVDADGDGYPDLLVTNSTSNDLSLLLNDGTGGLKPHERYGVGASPTFSAVADFDGDVLPDVASAIALPQYGFKSAIVTLRNLHSDTTPTPTPTPVATPTPTPVVTPTPTATPTPSPTPGNVPNPVKWDSGFNTDFFVRQHYADFLNREPDESGLAFWRNQIDECTSDLCREVRRVNVSGAFFVSIEFQQTGYLVERLYKAAYGDGVGISTLGGTSHQIPVPIVRLHEFFPDTQQIGRNVIIGQPDALQILDNNKVAFIAEFVSRARFTEAYPSSLSAAHFVDTLNQNAGDVLSQSQRDQLVSDLAAGVKNRAQVLRAVAEDRELFTAELSRASVLAQYFGYLRRNPNEGPDSDYTGYDFWLGKLNQFHGNFIEAEMVKAFITSGEYQRRFDQVPPGQ